MPDGCRMSLSVCERAGVCEGEWGVCLCICENVCASECVLCACVCDLAGTGTELFWNRESRPAWFLKEHRDPLW